MTGEAALVAEEAAAVVLVIFLLVAALCAEVLAEIVEISHLAAALRVDPATMPDRKGTRPRSTPRQTRIT